MDLPSFLTNLPEIKIPFPADAVRTNAIQSDKGLMVIFEILKDATLPPHSHKGQWGTVIAGEFELTIGEETKIYKPGMSYDIPAGVIHSGKLQAGAILLDIFEEPDRYELTKS